MSAAAPRFDDTIHSPVRLRNCGVLRQVAELEFAVIRDTLELTDANVLLNLKVLSDASYVAVCKESSDATGG